MRILQKRRQLGWEPLAAILAIAGIGCAFSRDDVTYLSDPNVSYYRDHATEIDYPAVEAPTPSEVAMAVPPVTVRDRETTQVRDITLDEAIQLALMNSQIIRTAGSFLATGNGIFSNPNGIDSVYDPAIQESGVLFGGRGVEAALAAFDAQLQTSMIWGRDEQAQNNQFFGGGVAGGNALVQESGNFNSSLSKTFANGASISLNHIVNYRGTNSPSLFQSVYTGNVNLQYQLPLLAGSGTEFTRVAGPIGQSFGGISGVSQGVLIARINNDLTLADFEAAVQNLVKDVQDTYWDLFFAYQQFHIAVQTRESTYNLWKFISLRAGRVREVTPADRFQAEDQYFAADVAANDAQASIYTTEIRLRRLLGLSVGDGSVLKPIDPPVSAELIPDWHQSLTEALTHRVELRRQKWNIKSLQLQLVAAESLVQPRLDFVGGYNVNGFGDDLLGYDQPYLGNYYETLGGRNFTGWNLGFQMQWNIGMRSARTQVHNYELRVAKAEKVLLEQQEEISHELGVSFQELARAYRALQLNYKRVAAVQQEIEIRDIRVDAGSDLPDNVLRALIRGAQAEVDFQRSLVDYNKALTNYELRKGTLLANSGVRLAEGGWNPEAYTDANFLNNARLYAKPNDLTYHSPPAFAVDAPFGGVSLALEDSPQGDGEPAPAPVPTNSAAPPPAGRMVPAETAPIPPAETPVPDMAPLPEAHISSDVNAAPQASLSPTPAVKSTPESNARPQLDPFAQDKGIRPVESESQVKTISEIDQHVEGKDAIQRTSMEVAEQPKNQKVNPPAKAEISPIQAFDLHTESFIWKEAK